MNKQRPSDHLTSGLFNVLTDVCASGTYCDWEQADSIGTVDVIAPLKDPSFRRSEMHAAPNAHILQTSTFDQQTAAFENH
jgi:hypothetical protein